MKATKRVVITGGHHSSALVVAEALRQEGFEIIWLGHKYSLAGDKNPSAKYQEVTQAGFRFATLQAAKSHRWWRPANLWRFPWGFTQALFYLLRWRPQLILSFGGYLAVPVVLVGWLMGIPCLTHEQTVVYGLANRLIAYFAKKVLVAWPQSLKHFPAQKVVLTGLPLRQEILAVKAQPHRQYTIYITGGKQGAHLINQAVRQALPSLLAKYRVIHQCGWFDWPEFRQLKKKNYTVKPYFFRQEIGSVLAQADLVVSRAGAHTVYELAALGKPALLIPIPWAYADEQQKNAQLLADVGLAQILPQSQLTAQTLCQKIATLASLPHSQKQTAAAKKLIVPDATQKIVNVVQQTIE